MSSLTIRLLFLLFSKPNVCQVLYRKGFPLMKNGYSSNHYATHFSSEIFSTDLTELGRKWPKLLANSWQNIWFEKQNKKKHAFYDYDYTAK
jgi:hypothetical protein